MNTYLHNFQSWLQHEDKGAKTISTYLSVMTKFVTWVEQTEGSFDPCTTTPLLLQDYRSHMQNVEGLKPATINKALATLKTFYSWCVDADIMPNNPALKVKMKRVQQTHAPKWLSDVEQNRLMYALESQKNEFKQARDKAIVMTMLHAGLRVEEVSNLRISDVDLKGDAITVTNGKGGKYRSVPMTNELRKALKTWLGLRQASDKVVHDSEYLFVSERASKLTTRGIGYMVTGYMERCGLDYSCHALRHTFCKNLVNAGWSIQNVARVAGHDSIQTTMRYVEPSEDELRKAMQDIR